MTLPDNWAAAIQLHYWFENESHSMDAFVQNKCEYEFLAILSEISSSFRVEITIETEPLEDGGLRRWFNLVIREEGKKAGITAAIIVSLLTTAIITPLGRVAEKLIDKIFEDKEFNDLDKENKKLQNEKLRIEIDKLRQSALTAEDSLDDNNVIRKRRSNFYETLERYPKVSKVSFQLETRDKKAVAEERFVPRSHFKNFILISDDLPSIEIENAAIEIISPVLKKGKYRWMGIYNGEAIPFTMKSNEFKTLVQTGAVKFVNGASINCAITIKRKIDNVGAEKITGYDLIRVNSYYESENPVETPEGKRHRQRKESDGSQMKLF